MLGPSTHAAALVQYRPEVRRKGFWAEVINPSLDEEFGEFRDEEPN